MWSVWIGEQSYRSSRDGDGGTAPFAPPPEAVSPLRSITVSPPLRSHLPSLERTFQGTLATR